METIDDIERAFPEQVTAIRVGAREAALTEARTLIAQHLRFGERARHAGGLARAHRAIAALEPVTPTLMEEYVTMSLHQRAIEDRQADSDEAGAVLDGATRRSTRDNELANEIERQQRELPL